MDASTYFGSCCACGKMDKETVRNIYFLHKLAPVSGKGWGCLQCGLPSDGAVAVVCDDCHDGKKEVKFAIVGYPRDGKRIPIEKLEGSFDHDYSKHPEIQVTEGN